MNDLLFCIEYREKQKKWKRKMTLESTLLSFLIKISFFFDFKKGFHA